MQQAAKQVKDKIEQLREQSGVSDSARAATMAALLIAFNIKKGENIASSSEQEVKMMMEKIDATLDRTDFPAKASKHSVNQ